MCVCICLCVSEKSFLDLQEGFKERGKIAAGAQGEVEGAVCVCVCVCVLGRG